VETILVHADGPVLRITLNRPEKGNMLTLPMLRELTQILGAVTEDGPVRAVVLRGNGDDFSRGRDPGPKKEGPAPSALDLRSNLINPILEVYEAIRRIPMPVISVVQGAALGFGCALAGVCDVTLAADTASFSLPEMRSGIAPTLAMSAVMDKVPVKALTYMVLSMGEINAATALQIGLVSRVVPRAELDAEVEWFCEQIIGRSTATLGAVKQYLLQASRMDSAGAAAFGANLLATVLSSR
jgi:enoyl-CoA hydratase